MKNKKLIIITTISIIVTLSAITITQKNIENTNTTEKVEEIPQEDFNKDKKELSFLKSISGIKANEIELIDNPIGLKGEFIAPSKSILKGIDYFLKDTQNSKMENIKIDFGEGYIFLKTTYKVNTFIKTPIEVKVKPTVDSSKNLVLQVYDFKFLDLKIADWILNIGVESFVKDWFPVDKEIKVTFEDGEVIIDRSNFESIILNSISINENGLKIDMIVDLEKVI